MAAPYRLYGADLSPYSQKVLHVLRYKSIPHEWLPRTIARQGEFQRFAKLPLVPVLVGADDFSQQDSTPIIETLERRYPEPAITPDDPALAFISALLEDYADEWVNKAMFHYRWTYDADQQSAARRIAAMMFEGTDTDRAPAEASIRERMSGRLHHVGSSAATLPVIEGSYARLLDLLEAHLSDRPYLFGARPALADFGLGAQLGQLLSDPTPGAQMRDRAPRVAAWVERLDRAAVQGPFEELSALVPTLAPLLREEVAGCYLPWMEANAAAAAAGEESMGVDLPGGRFTQAPQKYAARAFKDIRARYGALAPSEALDRVLAGAGCDRWFAPLPPRETPAPANDTDETSARVDEANATTEFLDPSQDQ
jgi:glutathione S-transferase